MPEFEESEGFKLRSGNKSPFKQLGSSPLKHKKDGSWIGHDHKTKLGKLTGKIAENIEEKTKKKWIKKVEEDFGKWKSETGHQGTLSQEEKEEHAEHQREMKKEHGKTKLGRFIKLRKLKRKLKKEK